MCALNIVLAIIKEVTKHWMAEELEQLCVQGYLVYQDNWTPVVGEQLLHMREEGNP